MGAVGALEGGGLPLGDRLRQVRGLVHAGALPYLHRAHVLAHGNYEALSICIKTRSLFNRGGRDAFSSSLHCISH